MGASLALAGLGGCFREPDDDCDGLVDSKWRHARSDGQRHAA
jgi:hypothetical protein